MRSLCLLVLLAASMSQAKTPPKKAATAKPVKVERSANVAKPVASAKSTKAPEKNLESLCKEAWSRGDLTSLRRKCAQTTQTESASSLYWSSLLATEPPVLRKTLSATHLKGLDSLDSRLLLLAARYQFSVGEARELKDLAWLAAKRKLKDARIDTLKMLAEGK
ncbi:MAG: hypothetical protein IPK50_04765 [Fibrobacterota bacterium]|nr:MAG: hypothetical protein IPK50_04765 [Fibrobacterota bacterium]